MSQFAIVRTVADLRAQVAAWKKSGQRVALVPTMGALHEGHLSLIALAKTKAERVVASIFVNPTQFGPNEDFDAYPRGEARDAELLAGAGCDLLFAPTVAEMYPQGFSTSISVTGVSEPLDGAARPGHFGGVATVVAKLLLQCGPDVAVFGEKDYQQLQVIKRMVHDLAMPFEIVGMPTVREADGLAMSSRNRYMSAGERAKAVALYRELNNVAKAVRAGKTAADATGAATKALLAAGFDTVEYLTVTDPDTLAPLERVTGAARVIAATRLGRTRLIDNIAA